MKKEEYMEKLTEIKSMKDNRIILAIATTLEAKDILKEEEPLVSKLTDKLIDWLNNPNMSETSKELCKERKFGFENVNDILKINELMWYANGFQSDSWDYENSTHYMGDDLFYQGWEVNHFVMQNYNDIKENLLNDDILYRFKEEINDRYNEDECERDRILDNIDRRLLDNDHSVDDRIIADMCNNFDSIYSSPSVNEYFDNRSITARDIRILENHIDKKLYCNNDPSYDGKKEFAIIDGLMKFTSESVAIQFGFAKREAHSNHKGHHFNLDKSNKYIKKAESMLDKHIEKKINRLNKEFNKSNSKQNSR